jgi:arabinose-5-phosphate isomerase
VGRREATVKEALLLMTKARSGVVSVVNSNGTLAGVFTDGDLRRQMAADEGVLSKPLSEVMTPDPVCVQEEALAAEALKIFKEKSIDDLVVVNARGRPVGLVDLQDLPKMKIL